MNRLKIAGIVVAATLGGAGMTAIVYKNGKGAEYAGRLQQGVKNLMETILVGVALDSTISSHQGCIPYTMATQLQHEYQSVRYYGQAVLVCENLELPPLLPL